MRVLHLISSGGMYGAEAVILSLSKVLNETGAAGIIGAIANPQQPPPQLHEAALRAGVESTIVACRGQLDWRVPSRIRDLIRSTHADILHAHGYKADVYARLASRGSSFPLVSTCHTWYDNDLSLRLYGALDRRVLRHFDRVVAVSGEVRKRLLAAGVASERTRLIRNGVDLNPFDPIALARTCRPYGEAPLRVGLVGRLSVEKGVDVFIEAAARVLGDLPNTRFVVAGDGPDRASLEQQISRLGVNKEVVLLGQQRDMPGLLASLDLVVSASRQEGLPIALLEAVASGLPLVATKVGEVPQIVRPGTTGILVSPGDPAALAAAIAELIHDHHKRQQFGSAGRELVLREFSAQRMAADYLGLYQEVLDHAPGSRPRQQRGLGGPR